MTNAFEKSLGEAPDATDDFELSPEEKKRNEQEHEKELQEIWQRLEGILPGIREKIAALDEDGRQQLWEDLDRVL